MSSTTPPQSLSSPLPVPTLPKFRVNQPSRPMLSRDADAMYWMSRYIERAEHVARILLIHTSLLTDVGDLAPALQEELWQSILQVMRLDDLPPSGEPLPHRIAHHMTFDAHNPSSLLSCLTRARENARAIRENISAEMWESINVLYWSICSDEAVARFEEAPHDVYRQTMTGSFLFQGLTDQTLGHDQRWLFTQIAKYFERIDVTCRVIATKYRILKSAESTLETPLRNIHWMAALRTCCSIEAYRRENQGDLDPVRVSSFLILEKSFPRSIRYCVGKAHDAAAEIRAGVDPRGIDPAERILGRLDAQLEYAETQEILREGIPEYLQKIQNDIADAAMAVQRTHFLH